MTYDPNAEPNPEPAHPQPFAPIGGDSLLRDERRQRMLVIGLSVGAVVVLLAGIIAFAVTRSGNDTPDATVPTVSLAPIATEATTTTSTTTTSTTSTTSTTLPILAVADAGPDLAVDRGVSFTLTASNLAPGTPDAAVRWTQTAGPDVTDGIGTLTGPTPVAIAPPDVTTLAFRLDVAGTDGVAEDDLIVRVFEDADRALFVDGARGDDGGDGSAAAPFRTLDRAVGAADGRDVYVRSTGTYLATATLVLGEGTSLYGGFDEDWVRDISRRAVVEGVGLAVSIRGPAERWISAIELTSVTTGPDEHSIAIEIQDVGVVHIEDSRIVAGDGGESVARLNGGASVGVLVDGAEEVLIKRSTVNSGRAADGLSGNATPGDASPAPTGGNATAREPGQGGGDGPAGGGDGGRGGLTGDGSAAPGGGAGGTLIEPNGQRGDGGAGGAGGAGGDGGVGLTTAFPNIVPLGADGAAGANGSSGSGGRGGGGGFGPALVAGGGGGGGGAGGAPAAGAGVGGGGVGSVGIWATDVERLVVSESLVAGGRGGNGGSGSLAGAAGAGGAGGEGAQGAAGVPDSGGAGGGAGGGGGGGQGGQGGGGAGGPSYGMLTTRVASVEVTSSTVRAGSAGNGAGGGQGGNAGAPGAAGDGRSGGTGGTAGGGPGAPRGVGASGGSSFGWFDESGAAQVIDDAEFITGNAGRGGPGSSPGADGLARDTNV